MEWVTIRAKTLTEARDKALDALGVHEDEAEFDILHQGKRGFLGVGSSPAELRARVKPRKPKAKDDRRDRKRRQGRKGEGGSPSTSDRVDPTTAGASENRGSQGGVQSVPQSGDREEARSGNPRNRQRGRGGRGTSGGTGSETAAGPATTSRNTGTSRTSSNKPSSTIADASASRPQEDIMRSDLTLAEQAKVAVNFVNGLVTSFGVQATVQARVVEEDSQVEVTVDGDELGLLVGQGAVVLDAIQELTRTVVLRSANDAGHVHVDIAGYRVKRREALGRFADKVGEQVLGNGMEVALEPMSPADRKAIHDAITALDKGLATRSEGFDSRRHVVVSMAAATAATSSND